LVLGVVAVIAVAGGAVWLGGSLAGVAAGRGWHRRRGHRCTGGPAAGLGAPTPRTLESLLTFASAEGGDERAQRLGQENSIIIIVGGRVGPLRIGLDPGGPVKLKQPQPSGGVAQPG